MAVQRWKAITFCLIMFVISFGIHFLVGDFFPKTAGIIPDEYVFTYQVSSIAQGLPLTELGERGSKFIYPLLISPAFIFFQDIAQQLYAINLINSLFAALAIFPAYLIAKQILSSTPNEKFVFVFAILGAFLPDTFYSIGIMAEPVAVTAGLWWVYGAYKVLGMSNDRKRIGATAALSAAAYLLYALKEYYIVFFIAFVITLIILADRTWQSDKAVATKRFAIYIPIVFAGTFIVLYVISQFVFFNSLFGNSYHTQMSGNLFNSLVQHGIFYAVIIVLHIFVAAGILPLVVPLWKESRKYNNQETALGLFVFVALGTMMLVVLLTVVLHEEHTNVIRIIMRYYDLLLFVAAILCVKKITPYSSKEIKSILSQRKVILASGIFAIALLLLLGFVQYDNEGTSLLWLIAIFNKGIPLDGGEIDFVWMVIIRIAFVLVCGMMFYMAAKGKFEGLKIARMLTIFLCCSCLVSSILFICSLRLSHEISLDEVNAGDEIVEAIDKSLLENSKESLSLWGQGTTNEHTRFSNFSAESRYVLLRLRAEGQISYMLVLPPGRALGESPDGEWYTVVIDKKSIESPISYGLDEDNLILDTKDTAAYYYLYE